eukprot:855767-Prorocentrum_minimum.AAC.7
MCSQAVDRPSSKPDQQAEEKIQETSREPDREPEVKINEAEQSNQPAPSSDPAANAATTTANGDEEGMSGEDADSDDATFDTADDDLDGDEILDDDLDLDGDEIIGMDEEDFEEAEMEVLPEPSAPPEPLRFQKLKPKAVAVAAPLHFQRLKPKALPPTPPPPAPAQPFPVLPTQPKPAPPPAFELGLDADIGGGEAAVGRRLSVFWPSENAWFGGEVEAFEPSRPISVSRAASLVAMTVREIPHVACAFRIT